MKLYTRTKNCHGNYIYFDDMIKYIEGLEEISSTVINHSINLNGSVLSYKMIIDDHIRLNLNIDLNMFKEEPSLNKDQLLFGINDSLVNTCLSAEDNITPYNVTKSDIVNFFKESNLTKDRYIESVSYNGNKFPFKIFVPSKNTSFADYNLIIYTNDPEELSVTHTYTSDTLDLDIIPLIPWHNIISDISITASKPAINEDDKVTLTLTTEDTSITEIYAEPVFGMVSKTRIPLTNGVGNVNVISMGLSTGDPIRIKFGYSLFTGVTEYTNTVT